MYYDSCLFLCEAVRRGLIMWQVTKRSGSDRLWWKEKSRQFVHCGWQKVPLLVLSKTSHRSFQFMRPQMWESPCGKNEPVHLHLIIRSFPPIQILSLLSPVMQVVSLCLVSLGFLVVLNKYICICRCNSKNYNFIKLKLNWLNSNSETHMCLLNIEWDISVIYLCAFRI